MGHFIYHWTGADGLAVYDIISGPLPLILGLGSLGALYTLYKRNQCHDDRCLLVGHLPVANGEHHMCGKHYRYIMNLPKDHRINVHTIKLKHHAIAGTDLDAPHPQLSHKLD